MAEMQGAHRQSGHRVRFEWGPTGAAAVARPDEVAAYPFHWKDDRAEAYAAIAAEVDDSGAVPVLEGDAFVSSPA